MAYHVSPNGGKICKAKKGRCPYGADGLNHFNTFQEASEAYDAQMAQAFGNFEAVKKSGARKLEENAYQKVDKIVAKAYALKASSAGRSATAAIKAVSSLPSEAKATLAFTTHKALRGYAKATALTRAVSKEAKDVVARAKETYSSYVKELEPETAARAANYQKTMETLNATPATPKASKLLFKQTSRENLRIGDKLESGVTITSLKLVGETIEVQTRNAATGRFGPKFKLEANSTLATVRPPRSIARQTGAIYSRTRAMAEKRRAMVGTYLTYKARHASFLKNKVTRLVEEHRMNYLAINGQFGAKARPMYRFINPKSLIN